MGWFAVFLACAFSFGAVVGWGFATANEPDFEFSSLRRALRRFAADEKAALDETRRRW